MQSSRQGCLPEYHQGCAGDHRPNEAGNRARDFEVRIQECCPSKGADSSVKNRLPCNPIPQWEDLQELSRGDLTRLRMPEPTLERGLSGISLPSSSAWPIILNSRTMILSAEDLRAGFVLPFDSRLALASRNARSKVPPQDSDDNFFEKFTFQLTGLFLLSCRE